MLGEVLIALLVVQNIYTNVIEYEEEYNNEDVDFEDHEYPEGAPASVPTITHYGRYFRPKKLGEQNSAVRTLSQDEIREVKDAINELLAGRSLDLITNTQTSDLTGPNNEATKHVTFSVTGLTMINTVGPGQVFENAIDEIIDSAKRKGLILKSRDVRNRPTIALKVNPKRTSAKPKLSRTSIHKYSYRKNLDMNKFLRYGEVTETDNTIEGEAEAAITESNGIQNVEPRSDKPIAGGTDDDFVVKDPTNGEVPGGVGQDAKGEGNEERGKDTLEIDKNSGNQFLNNAQTGVDTGNTGGQKGDVEKTDDSINIEADNTGVDGEVTTTGVEKSTKETIKPEKIDEEGNEEGKYKENDTKGVKESSEIVTDDAVANTKKVGINTAAGENTGESGDANNRPEGDGERTSSSAPMEKITSVSSAPAITDFDEGVTSVKESDDGVFITNQLSSVTPHNNSVTTTLTTTSRRKTGRRRTTTSTTEPTTVATTMPVPEFDIPALVEIISNLTYELESNITDLFNQTLMKYKIPTCKTPAPSTTEMIIPDLVNASVVAKCFVCGLESTGIPQDAHCADAFAGDFLPLVPVDQQARGKIALYRKYCRYMDINGVYVNATQPRSLYGRFTGGCSVRWVDLSGVYTQRACRSTRRAMTGRHFASKRMAKLEMALKEVDNGCIISPMASLLPLSRGISLFARFHACVCTGSWCNGASASKQWFTCSMMFVCVLAERIVSLIHLTD